jgi:predicted RNA-binding protein YlqC (UPF0109 family)
MAVDLSISELLEAMVRAMVDRPEAVRVHMVEGNHSCVLELNVAPEDVAKVIGRRGAHASALRTIVMAAGGKVRKRCILEIVEDGSPE